MGKVVGSAIALYLCRSGISGLARVTIAHVIPHFMILCTPRPPTVYKHILWRVFHLEGWQRGVEEARDLVSNLYPNEQNDWQDVGIEVCRWRVREFHPHNWTNWRGLHFDKNIALSKHWAQYIPRNEIENKRLHNCAFPANQTD